MRWVRAGFGLALMFCGGNLVWLLWLDYPHVLMESAVGLVCSVGGVFLFGYAMKDKKG